MRPDLDIVVPVHNEQEVLTPSVERLHAYVRRTLPELAVLITIADNASVDGTDQMAAQLAERLPGVRLRRLEQKGRGRALREAWAASDADVVAYMDVDLSTDLDALEALVRPLVRGEADLAIGSRLAVGADVQRSFKRELISRTYNWLLHAALDVGFSDAQCGFKAIRREALLPLLDRIENQNWFFDTELLYLAEQSALRFVEVPVRWVEDRDSSVQLRSTVIEDLQGVRRLRRGHRHLDRDSERERDRERGVSPAVGSNPDARGAGAGS